MPCKEKPQSKRELKFTAVLGGDMHEAYGNVLDGGGDLKGNMKRWGNKRKCLLKENWEFLPQVSSCTLIRRESTQLMSSFAALK